MNRSVAAKVSGTPAGAERVGRTPAPQRGRTILNPLLGWRQKYTGNSFSIRVIMVYAALNLFTVLHHEPWLDEAQSWLIARDASLPQLLALMNYEGSPALWHLILWPLAQAGLPYVSQALVHWLIATTAVTVFMFRAPLARSTKVLLVFSYYMAYEYSVVARCYGLGILLMFLIAGAYEQRFRRPVRYGLLVLLLSNANVFSLFVASGLVLRYAYEALWVRHSAPDAKRARAGLSIMVLGAALAVLQLIPAADNIHGPLVGQVRPMNIPRAFRSAFFATSGDKKSYELVSAVILGTALLSILRKPGALFVVLWSYLGMCYVFVFRYDTLPRHHGLLLMVLMFGFWIAHHEPDRYWFGLRARLETLYERIDFAGLAHAMIRFCLLIGVAFSLKMHYEDIRYPFSHAKAVARFLLDHDLDRCTLITHNSCAPSAVFPYLPHAKCWYAGIQRYGTYTIWNTEFSRTFGTPIVEVVARARRTFPEPNDLVFLLSERLESPERYGLELLFGPETTRWITRDYCAVYRLADPGTKPVAKTHAPER